VRRPEWAEQDIVARLARFPLPAVNPILEVREGYEGDQDRPLRLAAPWYPGRTPQALLTRA